MHPFGRCSILISLCNSFDSRANDMRLPHIIPGVTGKMVFEQMLTILLGTGVGVAVVLYAVKPRQIGASQSFSGVSSIETISLPAQSATISQSDAAPMSEVTVTATQSPVVEAPAEGIHAISSSSVSTMTAEVAAASSGSAAISSIDATAAFVPVATSATVESHASPAARSHRAPRKSATASSRTHAKPRGTGSTRATRKR